MSDNDQIIPFGEQEEWGQIVDRLVFELADSDIPDKVVRATELLLAGWPTYKVAKQLGVTAETIRRWLTQYPTMAATLSHGKEMLSKWRMARLEQQFISAIEKSQEVLELNLDGTAKNGASVDPKTLTVVAAQARYIIGLFAGQRVNVEVTHELGETVLNARKDALDYLAQQLLDQQSRATLGEPIEVEYRIIDPKVDDAGPMLDENGNPPFGEMGKLSATEDGIQCHICGRRFRSLAKHLLSKHNMTADDYEMLYLLDDGAVRATEGYSK